MLATRKSFRRNTAWVQITSLTKQIKTFMTYYFTGNFVQLISGIEVSNTIVFLDSSVLPICFKSAIFHIKLSNLPNLAWSRFVNRRKRQFSSFTLIVSSIKLPKALRYCYLQDQKWCLSVHLAWFKPLSPAVTDKRIPRSTSNLLWQLWTVEEVRIFYNPKIFTPEEGKESIFFCNSFSTILKVVVSNKKTLRPNI